MYRRVEDAAHRHNGMMAICVETAKDAALSRLICIADLIKFIRYGTYAIPKVCAGC
jgi:hypothetical protein